MIPGLQEPSQSAPAVTMPANGTEAATAGSPPDEGISTCIAQAVAAYRRDLPTLLKDHFGEWVAYRGDQRLGFGTSKTQLYQECFARGLKRGEFLVECVEPELPRDTELFLKV